MTGDVQHSNIHSRLQSAQGDLDTALTDIHSRIQMSTHQSHSQIVSEVQSCTHQGCERGHGRLGARVT